MSLLVQRKARFPSVGVLVLDNGDTQNEKTDYSGLFPNLRELELQEPPSECPWRTVKKAKV